MRVAALILAVLFGGCPVIAPPVDVTHTDSAPQNPSPKPFPPGPVLVAGTLSADDPDRTEATLRFFLGPAPIDTVTIELKHRGSVDVEREILAYAALSAAAPELFFPGYPITPTVFDAGLGLFVVASPFQQVGSVVVAALSPAPWPPARPRETEIVIDPAYLEALSALPGWDGFLNLTLGMAEDPSASVETDLFMAPADHYNMRVLLPSHAENPFAYPIYLSGDSASLVGSNPNPPSFEGDAQLGLMIFRDTDGPDTDDLWVSARFTGDFKPPPFSTTVEQDLAIYLDTDPLAVQVPKGSHTDGTLPDFWPVALPPPPVLEPIDTSVRDWVELGRAHILEDAIGVTIDLDAAALRAHAQQVGWNGDYVLAMAATGVHEEPLLEFINPGTPPVAERPRIIIEHGSGVAQPQERISRANALVRFAAEVEVPHPRTLIRNAAVRVLKGTTIAGDRGFESRARPIASGTLPVVLVYTDEEDVLERLEQEPPLIQRRLRLQVETICDASKPFEDLLDDLCLQIENALTFDRTLSETADQIDYVETVRQMADESGRELAAARIAYDVLYTTDESPVGELPDFSGADLTWDIKPPVGSGESEPTDEIDLPEA